MKKSLLSLLCVLYPMSGAVAGDVLLEDYRNGGMEMRESTVIPAVTPGTGERIGALSRALSVDTGYVAERFLYHADRRITFYRRAHNWNDVRSESRTYVRTVLDSETPSYAHYVLRNLYDDLFSALSVVNGEAEGGRLSAEETETIIRSVVERHQASISNDELRFYINDIVGFSAEQAVADARVYEGGVK